MKLKILGTLSPYCKDNENGVGYMVTKGDDANTKIVFDLGYGTSRSFNFPDDFHGMHIIISHSHWDHFSDFSGLAYASMVYNNHGMLDEKFKLYLPKELTDDARMFFDHIIEEGFYEVIYYDENTTLDIDGLKITFQKTLHKVPCFAARITDGYKTICYSADSGFDESLIPFYHDSDILIHEAGFLKSNKVHEFHSTAEEAATVANNANVDKLLLTHFWPETDAWEYIEEAKEVFDNVRPARTGEEYEV